MFDSHIHTKNSADSNQTLDEICESAIQKGMQGIAICDHVDICFAKELDPYQAMKCCIAEVRKAKETYKNRIRIFQGVEFADYFCDQVLSERILSLCDYDVIIGSVHTLYGDGVDDSYSRVDWSAGAKSMEQVKNFFAAYLNEVLDIAERMDFDILAHLTCPLRYINEKYGRGLDENEFASQIDAILSTVIRRGIALEVNTSGVDVNGGYWLPSEAIIHRYYDMGGRLITLGSDAHVLQNIGRGFQRTAEMLKKIGFSSYCYYEKRKPYFVSL